MGFPGDPAERSKGREADESRNQFGNLWGKQSIYANKYKIYIIYSILERVDIFVCSFLEGVLEMGFGWRWAGLAAGDLW